MLTLLFSSLGLKRLIASLLSVIVEVLRVIPGTAEAVSAIEVVAGFFGITGITHAGVKGTLTKKKLATAAAAVSALIALSHVVPGLQPLVPYLEKIAAFLGAAAIGSQVSNK